jgi:hypothetical protein
MMQRRGAVHNGSVVLPAVHTFGSGPQARGFGHTRKLTTHHPTNRHITDGRDVTLLSARIGGFTPPVPVQTGHHLR